MDLYTEERCRDTWILVGDLSLPDSDNPAAVVLMLNKAAGDRTVYEEMARALHDRGIASLRLDLRGHGDSEWHPENRYTHEACVADVGTILDALEITQPVTLVGHSISGLHLARFAAENPERVKEVVLIDLLPG